MVTQERLKELLSYDPETGIFIWNNRTGKRPAGSVAGCKEHRGYVVITADRKRYYAHRLAWIYCNGQNPFNEIDHINGNKSDNRIKNLRDVTAKENHQNLKKATARNISSGFLGVRKLNGKYLAQITIEGKDRHLGTFNSAEEAHAVYIYAKRKFHAGCTI
jgi:hypothetical protein